ncbi:MAG: fumarylacetoacetate hydrolase family protein [Spirochaetes bacterium]|nr:fumarylacetoacetate hydrolase family protein [Spirochaetota bacterium]
MLKEDDIKNAASDLYDAFESGNTVAPLTGRFKGITVEDAYRIQMENVARRTGGGERIIGKKIGLTSFPMQKMLGVFEPDYGHLFESMLLLRNELDMSKVIQPKAEGELAFVMGKDLKGPGITPFDILRGTEFILPAIEIIDSRVADWKIKIQDTIADNASSAFIAVGTKALAVEEVDLYTTGMVLCKNGEVVATGAAAAVMGNPVNAVAWLVNKLSEFGVGVREGEIILSGSLTSAVDIGANDVLEVTFDRLGSVLLKTKEER